MASTTHLMTADELIRLPDDGYRHELIKGELLTMSPTGAEHGMITVNLTFLLAQYIRKHKLGVLFGAETGFKLESSPDTVLAPDVAFIRRERLTTISRGYHPGAPDLVVEVLSPGDRASKVDDKTARWLSLGASVVWLVNAKTRTVQVRFANGQGKLLTENDDLSGDEIVPGFSVRVAEIFD